MLSSTLGRPLLGLLDLSPVLHDNLEVLQLPRIDLVELRGCPTKLFAEHVALDYPEGFLVFDVVPVETRPEGFSKGAWRSSDRWPSLAWAS